MNKLFYGDNIDILRKYIDSETVDLCYCDPPFNSKRTYNQIYKNIGTEDKAQARAFIDTWKWDVRADQGYNDILMNYNNVFTKQSIELIIGLSKVLTKGSLLAYLIHMTLRIAEIYRVLKPTGSFYLHCDPTASHYLKLILDSIFCSRKGEFVNELVWCYSIGGRSKNNFGEKHDIILWYAKNQEWVFNGNDPHVRILRKANSHMKVETDKDGVTWQVKTDRKSGKEYRYPLDKTANDYWTDIEQLNREDAERLHYPTQKPEELLERIISASSNPGDIVLDAYCGCGTSSIVADGLNRKWIGIDITYQSISLILKRLEDAYTKKALYDVEITGIPKDFESAKALAYKDDDRLRKEFEKWAVLTYSDNRAIINEKKGGDGGIDGTAFTIDLDNEVKQILFSVKSDKILNPKVIRELNGTLEREKAVMGYLITLYPMENLVRESKKYGTYHNQLLDKTYPKIQVVSINELLEGQTMAIPTPNRLTVLKKAEMKAREKQSKLNLE